MKRMICALLLPVFAAFAFSGCGGSEASASKRESIVSEAASKAESVVDDIGEGVTRAVSAVIDEADRMAENGQVSDGDGIIGNELPDTTLSEDEAVTEDMTETETETTIVAEAE